MYTYLNSNNLLAEQQYGFRKLHSTEYAAVNLINHVAKQMESGHTCRCNSCHIKTPCMYYGDRGYCYKDLKHCGNNNSVYSIL